MPSTRNRSKRNIYSQHDYARRYGTPSAQRARSPFETDKGRIIHSAAFRRLQGKTQVFAVGERDFYRTRLTHSLEVAQLGRGMCAELKSTLKVDPDLVEAICLAHDIGHPAFGHPGEETLNKLMRKYGGFGSNPQNLRIATFLEAKFRRGGLGLTRATLDGLIKYPELYDAELHTGKPQFTYAADRDWVDWVKDGVKDKSRKPIEGAIADWADQIAYSVNDIEDSFRAGLLSFVDIEMRAAEISKAVRGRIDPKLHDRKFTSVAAIGRLARKLHTLLVRPKDLRQRKINLKAWTSSTLKELMHAVTIQRTHRSERSVRYQYSLTPTPEAESRVKVLKTISQLMVFADPRVMTLQHKGNFILRALFNAMRRDKTLLPLDFQQLLAQKTATHERLVCDFVSGMTDRYACAYFGRLFQPGSGSFYEDV